MFRQVFQLSVAVAVSACPKPGPSATPPSPYAVRFESQAHYVVDVPATSLIAVSTTGGFHLNADYPIVFVPKRDSAVQFSSDRIRPERGVTQPCADRRDETCAAELLVPLTPQRVGSALVSGMLHISVCSAETCLIEKIPLSVTITVASQ
jgi:hypothetical protein